MTIFGPDEVDRLRVALGVIARRVDRQVARDGMTRTQRSVLATIVRTGPVGAGELAEVEGLNPTMLSRLVGKLEAAGLIVRRADPDDKRAVRLTATREGRALQQRSRRERSRIFAERLATMAPEQVATLLAALPAIEALAESLPATPDAVLV